MGDQEELFLKKRHSFYTTSSRDQANPEALHRSDFNILYSNKLTIQCRHSQALPKNMNISKNIRNACGEYYKRYEYDDIPVKDDSSSNGNGSSESGTGDNVSLTESHLKKIENNVSEQLQTESSLPSLDSSIKFFKTTVQEIFDKFNSNMRDFEVYKKRFDEILKSREDSIEEMEVFIKDMIRNIISSNTVTSESLDCRDQEKSWANDSEECPTNSNTSSGEILTDLISVVQAFHNENYLTDSTFEKPSSNEGTFNQNKYFYFLSTSPCVQIKISQRSLLSDVMKKPEFQQNTTKYPASAEDLKKLAAKKLELEQHSRRNFKHNSQSSSDREIPIKNTFPKKNIHLNEDFDSKHDYSVFKYFMSKVCSYVCKRLRRA